MTRCPGRTRGNPVDFRPGRPSARTGTAVARSKIQVK